MRRLIGRVRRGFGRLFAKPPEPPPPVVVDLPDFPAYATCRMLVGPANFAGQGLAWARAADEHLLGVASLSVAYERDALAFPVDFPVPVDTFKAPEWAAEVLRTIREAPVTHVLVEGMRAITGPRFGADCWNEIPQLRMAGASVALVGHGSEVRSPRRIAAEQPGSAFDQPDDEHITVLQARADRTKAMIDYFGGPVFVSTPDLLADLPGATWLPVVVDMDHWTAPSPALERTRPVLMAAPTHPQLKGFTGVVEALTDLDAEGVIELRVVAGVSPRAMPAILADVDIVLDQFLVGGYGLAAVQAMASGRLVVGHVSPLVRELSGDVPIAESSAGDLVKTVRCIVEERDRFAALAAAGPAFVRRMHDGRRSAAVLAPFLGVPTRAA
jgi:hypothetical protein